MSVLGGIVEELLIMLDLLMISSGHSPFSDAGAKSMKLRHLSPTAEKQNVVMTQHSTVVEESLAATLR